VGLRRALGLLDASNDIASVIPETGSPTPVRVAAAAPVAGSDPLTTAIARSFTESVVMSEALAIPSVRKAVHVIAGTISTFALAAWAGTTKLAPEDRRTSWLAQPDPDTTAQAMLRRTVSDLIWRDRAFWRVLPGGRFVGSGLPAQFRYTSADRVTPLTDPDDVDHIAGWLLDGVKVERADLVVFDGAGIGGLRQFGWPLLELYSQLMAAAGRYAAAPLPTMELHNTGADMSTAEIAELLTAWETARQSHATAYTNSVLETKTFGWSAKETQLVEAREEAALEVARLFGLPAQALDAPVAGSNLTYANVLEARKDRLEALRPWMAVLESGLSIDDRTGVRAGLVLPRGIVARFDVDAYLRDDPATRMDIWTAALAAGILTIDEVRSQEPLAWTGG
jgi:Phage portal protein